MVRFLAIANSAVVRVIVPPESGLLKVIVPPGLTIAIASRRVHSLASQRPLPGSFNELTTGGVGVGVFVNVGILVGVSSGDSVFVDVGKIATGGSVHMGVNVPVVVGTNVKVEVDGCVWVGVRDSVLVGDDAVDVRKTICVSAMEVITASTIS